MDFYWWYYFIFLFCNIKMSFTFRKNARNFTLSAPSQTPPAGSLVATLWVDYIYLDVDERRRFAQVSHEYLVEQLQSCNASIESGSTIVNANLYLNHPVKELVWLCRTTSGTDRAEPSNHTLDAGDTVMKKNDNFAGRTAARAPITSASLYLNGKPRFDSRIGSYFNFVQPRSHHTNIPDSRGIYVYSFSLRPEDHHPSGTCNFSIIDNAQLRLGLDSRYNSGGIVKIYATNYNILRIMSGMAGLAYCN
jgi:hypothetical protein